MRWHGPKWGAPPLPGVAGNTGGCPVLVHGVGLEALAVGAPAAQGGG